LRLKPVGVSLGSGLILLMGWLSGQEGLELSLQLGMAAALGGLVWRYETRHDRSQLELSSVREEAGAAQRGVRLVLDHIDQGLLMVAPDGRVAPERSRAAQRLLGSAPEPARLWELLADAQPPVAERLRLDWKQLFEGTLPTGELPSRCELRGLQLRLSYVPVQEDGRLMSVLVVVSDASAEQTAQQDRDEQLEVFRWVSRDRALFASFRREAGDVVGAVADDLGSFVDQRRGLHALESHAALVGLGRLAICCREIEHELVQSQADRFTPAQRQRLRARWHQAQELFEPLHDLLDPDAMVIRRKDHDELVQAARSGTAGEPLAQLLERWAWEPASLHLGRIAEEARLRADRLGRAPPRIQLDSDSVRLPDRWQPFWAAAVNVVHNALDHGIEPPEERAARGKPAGGELTLSVRWTSEGIFVSFQDDGRGIDWQAVADQARQAGLPSSTVDELVGALFTDPRHGLGAVWAATDQLGGAVQVESVPGRGTTIRFWFPPSSAQQTPLADRLSA
jgi:two-component system chemotaxis sensor kinase CheA